MAAAVSAPKRSVAKVPLEGGIKDTGVERGGGVSERGSVPNKVDARMAALDTVAEEGGVATGRLAPGLGVVGLKNSPGHPSATVTATRAAGPVREMARPVP